MIKAYSSRFYNGIKLPLFINAWYILGINIFPAFIGFLYWTIASRYYDIESVGISAAIFSCIALISGFASLGLNIGLIRFIPSSKEPTRLINSALNISSLLTIFGSVIFLLGLPIWGKNFHSIFQSPITIFIFVVLALFSTQGALLRDILIALGKSNHAFVHTLISQITRLIILLFVSMLGINGLIGSTAFSFFLASFIYTLIYLPKACKGYHWKLQIDRSDIRAILPFSMSNYFSGLILNMAQTIIPLLTIQMVGIAANAHSYIALMIGIIAASPGQAIAYSAFAESSTNTSKSKLIIGKASLVSLAITVFLSIFLIVFASPILMLFGEQFSQQATPLLRWMGVATPFIVMNHFIYTILRILTTNRLLIILCLITMISTIVTSYILLPIIGISANGVGILVGNLITLLIAITLLPRIIARKSFSIK